MSLKFGDRLLFIGGDFLPAASGQWVESVNPATEEVHGRVPLADREDVERAVRAAEAAQPAWAARSVWERLDVVRLGSGIVNNEKELKDKSEKAFRYTKQI